MEYFVYLKCENKHTIHTMTKVLYKSYTQNDSLLFPPCIGDFIPENHPVRTVNAILDNFDISEIESTYKGGGTTSYHPRMLLKIVVYAYLTNIYSGRRMASLLEENVFFMWLSGMSRPDFRTINRFLSVAQTDREGNRLNIIKVDGMDSADEKVIGKRLQEIAKNATTGGLYTPIGEFYGLPIKVVSERILKEGLEFTDNRFVVEGNYKYTYNNGHLAMADPVAAARNFLNAIERIPSIIDQYKAKNEVLEREIPQLQDIAGKVWKKEDELKQLKSELAALDRKIQLELAPPTPEVAEKENDGQQVKPEMEDVRNGQPQYHGVTPPQIRSPADSIVANHVIIGRPGLYAKEETRSKGLKI